MTTTGPGSGDLLLTDHFTTLEDPRRTTKGNIRYSLEELIFLTLSAVVSGTQKNFQNVLLVLQKRSQNTIPE